MNGLPVSRRARDVSPWLFPAFSQGTRFFFFLQRRLLKPRRRYAMGKGRREERSPFGGGERFLFFRGQVWLSLSFSPWAFFSSLGFSLGAKSRHGLGLWAGVVTSLWK